MPRTARGDEGQWAVSGRTPLTAGEQAKSDDDGINVRARIERSTPRRDSPRSTPPTCASASAGGGSTPSGPGIDGGRTGALEDADIEDSYFMLRVRVPGGQLRRATPRDRRGRGGVRPRRGRRHRPPEHPVHWIRIEDVPQIWRRLESVGLTTRTTCGDAPRNILGCPVAGIDAGEIVDASGVLEATEAVARASDDLTTCRASGRRRSAAAPVLHRPRDQRRSFVGVRRRTARSTAGFDLWVGGGLSTNPMIAQRLGAFVEPARVPAVWRGVTELFRDYGYRRLRTRARLKFLVADWGPEQFREVLEKEYLGGALPDGPAPPPPAAGRATTSASTGSSTAGSTSARRCRWAGRRAASSWTSPGSHRRTARGASNDRRAEATDPRRARRPGEPAAGRAHGAGPRAGAVRLPARHHRVHRHRVLQARHRRDQGARRRPVRRARAAAPGLRHPDHDQRQRVPERLRPVPARRHRSQGLDRRRLRGLPGAPRRSPHHAGRGRPRFGRKLRGLKVTAEQLPDYVERLLRTYQTHRTDGEPFAAWVQRAEEGLLQ